MQNATGNSATPENPASHAPGGIPAPARGRRIYLETFGCQMNELDSELVRSHLSALGYAFTPDSSSADVILYNTCSVREQAENKTYSRVGVVGREKVEGRQVVLGVIGCMAERDGESMMSRFPQIDLLCGPGELDKLPMLLDNAMKAEAVDRADRIALQGSTHRRTATLSAAEDNLELLDLSRAFDPDRGASSGGRSAYVRITRGCNKFCTYCVVPYTRGAEVHRPPDHIVDECKRLAAGGVIEITLLGQTVNHYVYTHGSAVTVDGREAPQVGPGLGFFRQVREGRHAEEAGQDVNLLDSRLRGNDDEVDSRLRGNDDEVDSRLRGNDGVGARVTTFADLLARIHDEVPAIQRLRFVTSYPRDFTDEALRVMAALPRICRYLHVPAQSGSNRILKLMNRGYTVEEYVDFIDRARAIMPDVSIAGDIIVGFPGETEEDFEQTKALLRRVRFKNNFIFKYSPRPGTVAITRFVDDVPEAVKRRRNNELLALQNEISARVHAEQVGRMVDVMVEGVSFRTVKRSSRGGGGGSGRGLTGGGSIELRWEKQRERVQMTGRTGGDLIVAFDVPDGASEASLVGSIVPVHIIGSGPLVLMGEVA